MDFYEVLEQVLALLQRHGRVSYRALKRQFDLEDDYLEDLKLEIIKVQQLALDQDGEMLVWTGETEGTPLTKSNVSTRIEPSSPEPQTPDAERRQLTVMFCDLADSTRLSGQLDPEDLRDMIRAYQSTSAEVIERYDGYIAQHLGDGLMVYFGWPQAHEDDAQRAVHAGLGIIGAMQGLNAQLIQEKGIRLAVRIGIHTGLVVVGEVGRGDRQEHLALGETPNIASRIEGIAASDTVVISDATYALVQGYFVCKALGQHTLKGVDTPQQVYRVAGKSDAQSRLDVATPRGLTPLIGRESESTLLFDRWRQAKEGQGQIVLLSGEAGIGKSRLLQVIKDHVAGEVHTLLECRSSPYYQSTALYPITELLPYILGWQQDDPPEEKLDKLEQTLHRYQLELNEAIPLFAALLTLAIPEDRYPPLHLSSQQQRQRTLETILALLIRQTVQQPVLFILEDLHWTDPSTLELLDLLIDQIPTAPIYVLLACRPTFQPPWSSRSYLTQITLSRLSCSQIERMAERVANGKRLPAEVLQQIVEKTDGVPLFVEEMTKAVLESGALKEVNGQYELAGSFSSLTIPATLQDSLMARLDRLVTAKAVAQYASIIGRQFSYALLHAVSQLNERTLQDELQRLVEAELLYQRGSPPEATYLFKHALIVDAAYASLLKSTRQQYHQRIAQTLEERFQETAEHRPELLAHHYTAANHYESAIGYWQQAGQHTMYRSAYVEAIGHLSKGLDLLKTLPRTPERIQQELTLQTMLSSALVVTRGLGAHEVRAAYDRARELCQQVGDTPQIFSVLRGLWMYYLQQEQVQATREVAEQLLALAQRQQDSVLLTEAHRALGATSYWLGAFVLAHKHLQRGIALYDCQHYRSLASVYGQDPGVSCLSYLSWVLWYLGYPDQALQQSQKALTLARELSHSPTLAWALCAASWTRSYCREGQAAHELAEEAIVLSTKHEFPHWTAMGRWMRGLALAELGQWEKGITQIQQGVDAYQATGAILGQGCGPAEVAKACVKAGRLEDGLRELNRSLVSVHKTGIRHYEAEIYRLQGELLLTQDVSNASQAEVHFNQAIDIARHQQAKSLELRAATSLARLWQSQGKRQQAYELLQPVYGWFTEGFDTADLKDAKALLDELG